MSKTVEDLVAENEQLRAENERLAHENRVLRDMVKIERARRLESAVVTADRTCRFWLRGQCFMGDRCNFKHE